MSGHTSGYFSVSLFGSWSIFDNNNGGMFKDIGIVLHLIPRKDKRSMGFSLLYWPLLKEEVYFNGRYISEWTRKCFTKGWHGGKISHWNLFETDKVPLLLYDWPIIKPSHIKSWNIHTFNVILIWLSSSRKSVLS